MVYTPVRYVNPPVVGAPRRRRHWWTVVLVVLALIADVTLAAVTGRCVTGTVVSGAYAPAFDRTLEHAGGSTPLDANQIDKIAANAGVYVFSKYSQGWDLSSQFAAARDLKAAAEQHQNDIKIWEYFSASYWFTKNEDGWGKYADGFKQSWLLKDDTGRPIEFHGVGNSADSGDDPIGYMVDLSNPAYRAWAVKTVVAWVKAAPIDGINFDSAKMLGGDTVRAPVGDGKSSYDELLCGVSTASECPRVTEWNDGLTDLLQAASEALHPLGATVTYNGVAENGTTDRNQELLKVADAANNEDFCLEATPIVKTKFDPTDVRADIDMMVAQNADGKTLVQITNYQTTDKQSEGPFCLGAFLMGWTPNLDYWTWHQNYSDPLDGAYPQLPEINLDLGSPTAAYRADGGLLTRTFANGFVMVNTGSDPASAAIPRTATEFAGGLAVDGVDAGSQVEVPARGARFFLWSDFVGGKDSAAASASSTPFGCPA